jgi:hypothetical protein
MRQETDGRPETGHDTMTTERAIIDASLPVPSRSVEGSTLPSPRLGEVRSRHMEIHL